MLPSISTVLKGIIVLYFFLKVLSFETLNHEINPLEQNPIIQNVNSFYQVNSHISEIQELKFYFTGKRNYLEQRFNYSIPLSFGM